ncbi:MAG: ABC transporter ATP-binding protein [Alphaproteobacteria bacterium]|nr:ABC transporter ATP-binding protein [Alphaproteobacteria bacterium]
MYFDRNLWAATQGLRGRIALSIALGLAATAAGFARFVLLGMLLAGLFEGASLEASAALVAAIAASVVLRGALDHARTLVANATAAAVQTRLRGEIYDKIVALGPAWFAADRTGGVMLSMVDGVEQLQTFFGQYVPQLCVAALVPIAIFAVIAWWDVPVASVLLGFALLALFLPLIFHRLDKRAGLARQHAFKTFGEEFLDAMQGLPTLKAFGQSGSFGRKLAARARALSNTTMWVLSTSLMTRGVTDFGVAVGAAAALALGAARVSQGQMSLEALLVVLMAGTELFRPLRDLRAVLHRGMVGQSAAEGINALLATAVPATAGSGTPAASLKPTIAFEAVGFAYPGGRGAAHDGLSFTVAAGERVGIVGPSGAGKSSIVRLLLRLHDAQRGTVRIGGHDVTTLDPETVRGAIAVVQQDTTLFHGTIEDNLRLGRPDATPGEIEAAARAANAHDFIAALPQGYATPVGERGARLSGGQRQRIAIARALLRDAPILILDEALSSVDAESEALIQAALDRLMRGRTTIILAHRLSSVIDADRILVLDQGRVVESGRHQDLIARDGPYRRLMGAQADAAADSVDVILADRLEAPAGTRDADGAGTLEETPAEAAERIGWRATFASLLAIVRPWRTQVGATIAFSIGRVAAMVAIGVIGALIVAAVRSGTDTGALLLALAIVAPLAGLLHWLESWLAHDVAYRLLADMRIALYQKLDSLAPAYLARRRSGDLVALAAQDIETVEYFFAHTIAPAFVAILVPAAVILALALLAWPVALALAPFLLYAALSPVHGRRRIDALGARAREGLGAMSAHVADTIQGLGELVAFQALARRRASFLGDVERYQRDRIALLADLSRQSAALEVATGLGMLAVAVTGALLIRDGGLEPAVLPLLILVAGSAFLPVSEIAQVGRQLADTIASTRRLAVVHGERPAVVDGPRTPAEPPGGSRIEIAQVGFTYPGRRRPALTDVSLDIAAGSMVALVGPSGAGKTTLANLLLRFWDPAIGAIRIDGVDLRDFALDSLRRQIALVAQDTYLFNDTLAANVRLARPEAGDDEVLQALDRAALGDFVRSLPEGLATRVGERGVQLSGGQRQRVAIARAFLRNARILILDEATSHLDAASEAAVREALSLLMRDRTTVVIAHRLSTVRNADLIAVIDDGRIRESGSHAELLARGGLYAHLVNRQGGAARGRAAG